MRTLEHQNTTSTGTSTDTRSAVEQPILYRLVRFLGDPVSVLVPVDAPAPASENILLLLTTNSNKVPPMFVRQPLVPKADLHRPLPVNQQSNGTLRLHALGEAKTFIGLVKRKILTVPAAERCLGVDEKQKKILLGFANVEAGGPGERMVLEAVDLRVRALREFRRRVRHAGFSPHD